LEWDARIPPYADLVAELGKAQLARAGARPDAAEPPAAAPDAVPTPLDHQFSLADA
jgi:hypothetical protein